MPQGVKVKEWRGCSLRRYSEEEEKMVLLDD